MTGCKIGDPTATGYADAQAYTYDNGVAEKASAQANNG